jgi:hypothetical protein
MTYRHDRRFIRVSDSRRKLVRLLEETAMNTRNGGVGIVGVIVIVVVILFLVGVIRV